MKFAFPFLTTEGSIFMQVRARNAIILESKVWGLIHLPVLFSKIKLAKTFDYTLTYESFFLFLLLTTWCHGRKTMLCDVLTPNKIKNNIYMNIYIYNIITASSPLCATSIKKIKPTKTNQTKKTSHTQN